MRDTCCSRMNTVQSPSTLCLPDQTTKVWIFLTYDFLTSHFLMRVVVCQLSSCGMWALSLYASHLLGSVFKGWKLCSEHEGQGSCPHAAYILVEEMGTKQVKK